MRLKTVTIHSLGRERLAREKECSVMDERLQFVARRIAGEPMAELCREFGFRAKPATKSLIIGRLRAIYGNETLEISGAELIEQDRSRY